MNYLKFTTLAFLLLAIAPLSSSAQDATPKDVSVIRAKLMLRNGSTMIDVREKEEVAEVAYDVENVINIPLSQLQARMSEVPKDKPLVIACQSGSRSEQASMILLENGYTDLVNMEGGMNAWQEKGLEVIADGKSDKKACCADPKSKDCNPDGTCKPGAKAKEKACCSGTKK
ncbi:MAG: rhodanese-like domain-containing protein [Flavobacteriales bacterium]|nr:rhodanese-like domain-containing protein [Flavobacteriales bacterium]MBK6943210.1 rhodanese-like domain-containing protein [Flavobacteriales bacterium]MBK7240907.1 rhodanese-like domain-containing protein [Flavobacteriales bacterium]MBK9536259.1 rhodanese-like domain-containing protein [Flavobacteriales bacterium]MBP9137922.1 rhodanese-like domain-containing protein [Flavobacteriales bacterium]